MSTRHQIAPGIDCDFTCPCRDPKPLLPAEVAEEILRDPEGYAKRLLAKIKRQRAKLARTKK